MGKVIDFNKALKKKRERKEKYKDFNNEPEQYTITLEDIENIISNIEFLDTKNKSIFNEDSLRDYFGFNKKGE